jgi:hypothetical protein
MLCRVRSHKCQVDARPVHERYNDAAYMHNGIHLMHYSVIKVTNARTVEISA